VDCSDQAGLAFGQPPGPAEGHDGASGNGAGPGAAGRKASAGQGGSSGKGADALGRSSPDLARRTSQAVSAWQDHVMRLVKAENVTKRSIARVVSFDQEPLALVLTIGLLGDGGDPADEGTSVVPRHLLTSMFGAGPLRELQTRARADLHDRIGLLMREETLRFSQLVDSAGVPDDSAADHLREIASALEAAR
jgi:hypothetical protein